MNKQARGWLLFTVLAVALAGGAWSARAAPPAGPAKAEHAKPAPQKAAPPKAAAPRPDAGRPVDGADRLPAEARTMLSPRMQRHGDDMEELLWAVVLLSRPAAADIADHMASEPRFAPPTGDKELLNQRIPPEFLAYQQQLHKQATALRDAARKGDDAAMGEAFSALSRTCVQCHAQFLGGRAVEDAR